MSRDLVSAVMPYGYSAEAKNFDKTGTVVPRDSDDRLKNMHLRQTEAVAVATVQSVAAVALRTEIPSFDPVRPEEISPNGHEKWPGEDAIETGERPAFEAENPEEAIEPESPQEPDGREKIQSRIIEFGQFAMNALKKRALELKYFVQKPEIDTRKYAKIASAVLSTSVDGAKKGYEKSQQRADSLYSEHKKDLRRSVIALGGLALAGAAIYLGQKGYSELHHSHAVQQLAHSNSAHERVGVPKEFKVPLQAHAVAVQASHRAHRVASAVKHAGYQVEHLKYYGDTIWFHAQSKLHTALGYKPSTSQLNKYVNSTLKLNHLNWTSAKEMVKGQAIKLPIIHR